MATEAQMQKALSNNPTCPYCHTASWVVRKDDGSLLDVSLLMEGSITGKTMNTYAAVCNNCGNVRLIEKSALEKL
jgi:transcription elongation factor Elf1